MPLPSRAVSAPARAGAQQFAVAASRPRLPALPRSRGRSSSLVTRAAIEAPRPSSPQPPQRKSSSSSSSSSVSAEASSSSAVVGSIPSSLEVEEGKDSRESVLCTRLAGAHSKAVTALLVLNDRDDVKEIVTASLDKTVALWRLVEAGNDGNGGEGEASPPCEASASSSSHSTSSADPLCSSAAVLVSRLSAACGDDRAPVFALAADVDGAADAARLERILANSSSSSSAGDAAAAAVRRAEASALDSPSAPSAPSSSSSASLLLPRLPTVFIGGGTPSVRGWQPNGGGAGSSPQSPPKSIPDVVLEGHAGWVRSLAASGRWLFSCGCGGIKQWDLSRAVPRCVATVGLPKGDVSALAATPTALFAGGADGSLSVWRLPTSRRNEGGVGALRKDAPPDAVVPGAHAARVSALAVVPGSGGGSGRLCSASHDGSLALWSLCVEGGAGPGEEEEACCVTHAEEEAAAAAAADEKKTKAAAAAKLVLLSRVSEAHGIVVEESPTTAATAAAAASAAVAAVAPASDASIPAASVAAASVFVSPPAVANKIHAAVVGSDGLLYSGGDDGLVARWVVVSKKSSKDSTSSLPELAPAASGPLHGHGGSPVRALAAGPGDALVSGDAAGNVLLWRL